MSDKVLAQTIVDWFMTHDCTETQALKATIKILKEANHDKR